MRLTANPFLVQAGNQSLVFAAPIVVTGEEPAKGEPSCARRSLPRNPNRELALTVLPRIRIAYCLDGSIGKELESDRIRLELELTDLESVVEQSEFGFRAAGTSQAAIGHSLKGGE